MVEISTVDWIDKKLRLYSCKLWSQKNLKDLSQVLDVVSSVTRKNLPKVYKSYTKMISLEKWYILTPLQKLPKNVGDLGKLIAVKGF